MQINLLTRENYFFCAHRNLNLQHFPFSIYNSRYIYIYISPWKQVNRKERVHCRLLSANRPGTCVIQTTKEVERKKIVRERQ